MQQTAHLQRSQPRLGGWEEAPQIETLLSTLKAL